MNEAVMGLYRDYGVNPMSGCLPLVIQMPILIALYRALLSFNYTAHAGLLWIPSLNAKDPYWIIPILAGVTTFWQSWLTTPNTSDPSQKTMIYGMPLFFIWITSTVPSGLGLYWIMYNLTGVGQQYIVNRMTPPPVKEVQDVADDRKDGKNGRGGRGGRPPGAKGAARPGGSGRAGGGHEGASGSAKQTGPGKVKG